MGGGQGGHLNQLLGLKEALQMPHLPDTSEDEDDGLGDGPPEHSLVGALASHPEPLFAVLEEAGGKKITKDGQTRTKTTSRSLPGAPWHCLSLCPSDASCSFDNCPPTTSKKPCSHSDPSVPTSALPRAPNNTPGTPQSS